ncbi:unnamed protein product [Gongylonema pulchrum]|uniref:Glyco_18 domain-containing protein n=1 Tax=Gongylonema pulchrum TaxID=637853 RepID=A0A183EJD1_9BILA|nr:unnamed protein product [Gongylonema pulchrum]
MALIWIGNIRSESPRITPNLLRFAVPTTLLSFKLLPVIFTDCSLKAFQELKNGFVDEAKRTKKEQLLLTAAVAAGKDKIDGGYDVPSLAKNFDLLFLMSYDLHGSWDRNVDMHAKLYATKGETSGVGIYNTQYAANYWAQKGMPKNKIIIGIPTYGQGWTLANPSQTAIGSPAIRASAASSTNPEGGTAAYWEARDSICDYIKSGGNETVNREGVGAYMAKGNQWYGYDNPETVRIKV